MTTGTIRICRQILSNTELDNEYLRISAENPFLSSAAAVTIADRYQPVTLGAQLAAFAAGSPVDAGHLLQDVLAAYVTVTSIEAQHELIALALWTAKHSTGYTDPPATCGHGTWLDSCREPHGQLPGSLPNPA